MFVFFIAQTNYIQWYQVYRNDAAAHGMIALIILFEAAYDLALMLLILSCAVGILLYLLRAEELNTFNFFISLALMEEICELDCARDVEVELLCMSPLIASLPFILKNGLLTWSPFVDRLRRQARVRECVH